MRYLAGIHDAWECRYPDNHDRISRLSVARLQCTRDDVASVATIPLDYAVPIVALIIDCTTDKNNFHLTREVSKDEELGGEGEGEGEGDKKEAVNMRANTLFQERVGKIDVTDKTNVDLDKLVDECIVAAEEEHEAGEGSGKARLDEEEGVSGTHKQLMSRKHTDRVPHAAVAEHISKLASRMGPHQTLHVLLTGCNTSMLALPLKHKLSDELQSRVWLLCTNEVWPSDLSSCLWHHYGALVSADLGAFRMNTRALIHDFTTHWQRQNIVNPAFEEARQLKVESLAHLVHLDRMDRVTSVAGFPKMDLL